MCSRFARPGSSASSSSCLPAAAGATAAAAAKETSPVRSQNYRIACVFPSVGKTASAHPAALSRRIGRVRSCPAVPFPGRRLDGLPQMAAPHPTSPAASDGVADETGHQLDDRVMTPSSLSPTSTAVGTSFFAGDTFHPKEDFSWATPIKCRPFVHNFLLSFDPLRRRTRVHGPLCRTFAPVSRPKSCSTNVPRLESPPAISLRRGAGLARFATRLCLGSAFFSNIPSRNLHQPAGGES